VEFIKKARVAAGAKKAAFWIVALGALTAGGLFLDGSSGDEAGQLSSLSPEQAAAHGLSMDEHLAYEAELPMIHAITEETLLRVDRELQAVAQGMRPSDLEIAESLHRNWQELSRFGLNPETVSAVQKLGARL
jgi:hypothetical protein